MGTQLGEKPAVGEKNSINIKKISLLFPRLCGFNTHTYIKLLNNNNIIKGRGQTFLFDFSHPPPITFLSIKALAYLASAHL